MISIALSLVLAAASAAGKPKPAPAAGVAKEKQEIVAVLARVPADHAGHLDRIERGKDGRYRVRIVDGTDCRAYRFSIRGGDEPVAEADARYYECE